MPIIECSDKLSQLQDQCFKSLKIWFLKSAILVSNWMCPLIWPRLRAYKKDSSIDGFSCYDKEAVSDNGQLICNECFDPTNPYVDITDDLDDDAYVNICQPGDALISGNLPNVSHILPVDAGIKGRLWIVHPLLALWLKINLNVFQTWKKIFWDILHWTATNSIIWSLRIRIQLWLVFTLI